MDIYFIQHQTMVCKGNVVNRTWQSINKEGNQKKKRFRSIPLKAFFCLELVKWFCVLSTFYNQNINFFVYNAYNNITLMELIKLIFYFNHFSLESNQFIRNMIKQIWNWVFATNSNFLIPISLQPDGVGLWYFKLTLFYLT